MNFACYSDFYWLVVCVCYFYKMASPFDKWWQQIIQKSTEMGNQHGCQLWQGAVTPRGYGQKRIRLPDGTSKLMLVSRVVYMCKHQTLNIPQDNINGEKVEMSHLCHNRSCVRQDHLILESHVVNMERQHCFHQHLCIGTHQPLCLI